VLWTAATGALVEAQLIAFPGAEGAGRLSTGGRGGDVYHVTNLNNTGAGSLRNGITTAPAAGRTIVFDVAGTIHLASSLSFAGKSKITIAGQTAPAGGITLADSRLHINDANNIIVQHIRVRPGSTLGSTDPDAIWVEESTNVIIDHVTASWGVDETISVTHDSDNVTVQWSTMTQGLFNAGHSGDDGVGHSYGSLINGGRYSFHHNLYAHSKSRHPRAQDSGDRYLMLDWVNNVVFNPGDEFGNSDSNDPYDMNLVGNYGIKGPQSGSNTSYLMRPQDVDSRFYVDGNYMDSDQDLLLDGNPVNGNAVFRPGGAWTLMPSRFDYPPVTTYAADQAYIQVMSRAGANNYRDAIDKRTIRTVFNHLPGFIDTQAAWGGWPTLPSGSPAPDSNGDGVPDAWATANGFSTSTPLNTTLAPDGYSYLEKYVHTLTPNAYAPTNTAQHMIGVGFGMGADAQVNENGGVGAPATGDGGAATLNVALGPAVNQALLLRFDISQLVPGSLTGARLDLTAAAASSGTFMAYGVEQTAADWNWNEAAVDFQSAPGLSYDANSSTLGINNAFTSSNHPDNPDVLNLGPITVSAGAGQIVSLTNPNLAVFLNLAAYYQGEASEGVVTIILQPTTPGSTASFHSKEGNPELAPKLVLDAVLAAAPAFDPADFNGDFVVDQADLANWSAGLGTTAGAERTDGDANGDGAVDGGDFLVWQQNFGNHPPSTGAQAAGVPEAAALALASWGAALVTGVRFARRGMRNI
jgi:pectate lyase